jgi:TusA-related sulfurtransferase
MLDLTAEVCPMTFVKTKVALHAMPKGEILEVLLQGEESLKNVPKAVEEGGDKVLSVELVKVGVHKVLIEKR